MLADARARLHARLASRRFRDRANAPGVSGAEAVPAPLSARSEPCEDKDSVTSRKCALASATGAPYAPLTPGASGRAGTLRSATVVGPEGLARGDRQASDPARAAHRINEGVTTNEAIAQLCDARPPYPAMLLLAAGVFGAADLVASPGSVARRFGEGPVFVRRVCARAAPSRNQGRIR